jgi:hypothetical protein
MHTSIFSKFLASHPGMLQTLPLKINFVLKVWTLLRLGWGYRWYHLACNYISNWLDIDDIPLFRVSLESSFFGSEQLLLEWVVCCLTTFLGNPIVFGTLVYLVLQTIFGQVPILGYWYVSNVSIIFDAPCLFLHHLPIVSLHLVAFLCIFRN